MDDSNILNNYLFSIIPQQNNDYSVKNKSRRLGLMLDDEHNTFYFVLMKHHYLILF